MFIVFFDINKIVYDMFVHRVGQLTSTSKKESCSICGMLGLNIQENGLVVIGCCIMTVLLLALPFYAMFSVQKQHGCGPSLPYSPDLAPGYYNYYFFY
jgi:hypothetical protein